MTTLVGSVDDDWAQVRAAMRTLQRSRRQRLRRHGYRKEPRTVELPELHDLDLPVAMPGEKVEPKGDEPAIRYYLPDGTRIPGDYVDAARVAYGLKWQPGNHWRSSTYYRAGARLQVSTVYLGLDHSFFPGPPLIWETMVFTGLYHDAFCARYATRAAALHGHRTVTAALRQAQAERRTALRAHPPRRPLAVAR